MNWLLNKLNKKILGNIDKVDLSIGPVYLKKLSNGMVNKCKRKACIAGNLMNDPYFLELMDEELSSLSKRQIDKLTYQDGSILRGAVRKILLEQKVIKAQGEEDASELSVEQKQKLSVMKEESKASLEKLYESTGYKAPGVE